MASVGSFARSAALPAQSSWVRRVTDAFLTTSTLTYVRTSSAAWSVCLAAYRLSSRTHSVAYLPRPKGSRVSGSACLAAPGSGLLRRSGGSGLLLARGGRPGVGACGSPSRWLTLRGRAAPQSTARDAPRPPRGLCACQGTAPTAAPPPPPSARSCRGRAGRTMPPPRRARARACADRWGQG